MYSPDRGPRRHRHPQALRPGRHVHLRPRLHLDRGLRQSTITYIDGDKGELLYRGYPIDQLAEQSHYLEVCYLLLYGELPTADAAGGFRGTRDPPHHGPRADAQLLPRLPPRRAPDGDHGRRRRRAVGLLPRQHRHHRPAAARGRLAPPDRQDADHRGDGLQVLHRPALRLSAATTSTTRRTSCTCASRVPAEEYEVNPILARAMDRIFILHADHEQNASTSTVRLAGVLGRQPVRLHRRRHRLPVGPGAWRRQRGLPGDAASEIGTVDRIPEFIARAKDKNDPFRLMGFGHRVYKNFDPRAKVMKRNRRRGAGRCWASRTTRLLQVAKELEKIALEDPYFVDKKLYPERRFLLGHHPRGDGLPDRDVHADLRAGAHRRLDLAVEGNDRRSAARRSAARASFTPARPCAITSTSKTADPATLTRRRNKARAHCRR